LAAPNLKKTADLTFESFLGESLKQSSPFKVLVLEENELVQKVMEIRLKNKGAQAIPLFNTKDLKKILNEKKIDLVVLSIQLGEVSGEEILKEIRGHYSPMQLPVIMMAEKSKEDELVNYLKIGANDFFTTPINFTLSWARIQTQALIKRFYESVEEGRKEKLKSASMKSLLEMVRNVAHEINNPLTIIAGKLEKMRMNIDSKKDIEIAIVEIEGSITRAENVIQSLQVFSQDETNKPLKPLKFNELISKMMLICHSSLLSEGIELIILEKDKGLVIKGKEGDLTQVLFNLIMNSRKALAQVKNPFIEISIEKDGTQYVKIAVTDNGKGVPKGDVDKLFEPFFTTSNSEDGLGMGLPLSKDLVEKNGGKLFFNTLAEKTQFIISLPIWN
jgi:signal transduction histidine kinase